VEQPEGAQSCVEPPVQIEPLPVIAQLGAVPTVTVLVQVLLHPLELVTVTVRVPAVLTVMQLVVAPVLHKYEEAPAATQSCVDPPGHIAELPVIVQTGLDITVTAWLQLLVQPPALVMVTEKVPAAPTVIHCVVAPVLHK
jgi:hypothetical protein